MARGYPSHTTDDPNNNRDTAASTSGNGDQNGANPRRPRLPLTLPLPIPLYTPPMEIVQEGGDVLFHNFVAEQFYFENIEDPPTLDQLAEANDIPNGVAQAHGESASVRHRPVHGAAAAATSTPEGYKNYDWTSCGRALRELADEFANSHEGEQVRVKAREAPLTNITETDFIKLVSELFMDGISLTRVVALFYYCALLLIRSRREDGSITRQLFLWSLRYIRDEVCNWVHVNGGWGAVLRNLYDFFVKVAFVVGFCVAITCGIVYIRKNF